MAKKKTRSKKRKCQVPREPERMGNPKKGSIFKNAPRNSPVEGV